MSPSTRRPTQEDNVKPRPRKPAVEKKRRDRINTGIERLKLLLKDDLNPRSKLEKADVLETAVAYLKRSTSVAQAPLEQCYTDGFARCMEEIVCFFAMHNQTGTGEPVMMKSLGHAIGPKETRSVSVTVSAVKSTPECTGAVWRPW